MFPYIPGFLSFREIDSTLEAVSKLKNNFDIVLVDGQGIAHPRRFGIACHLGVIIKKPVIGCAKKRLCGRFNQPAEESGSYSYLFDRDEKIGAVLRTRKGVKPIFISPGNLIDIDSSVKIIMSLVDKYRLPEPIRLAHLYAGEISSIYKNKE